VSELSGLFTINETEIYTRRLREIKIGIRPNWRKIHVAYEQHLSKFHGDLLHQFKLLIFRGID